MWFQYIFTWSVYPPAVNVDWYWTTDQATPPVTLQSILNLSNWAGGQRTVSLGQLADDSVWKYLSVRPRNVYQDASPYDWTGVLQYSSTSATGPWTTFSTNHYTGNASSGWTAQDNVPLGNIFHPPPPPACAYGAQPNPDATVYTVVTEVLVDAVVAALGMGPLGIVALDTIVGSPIAFPICGNVPSMPAPLTDADFLDGTALPNPASLGKWKDHFIYGVWLFYCECKPAPSGSPAPVNPPVPVLPPRLQPGPQPTSPCTNTDICATLNRITNILTTINVSIQNNSYAMPEPAYTWGALYANLTGNGEIAVSGILGAFVSFHTLPNRAGGAIGDPNTLFEVGHIAFGTPDGWFPRVPITSNPWLTLPQHMANVSKLGYSIPQDCVVDIHLVVPAQLALAAVPGT